MEMAQQVGTTQFWSFLTFAGAEVKVVGFEYDDVAQELDKIQEELRSFAPKLVTIIHCETPSGTLNPIEKIGPIVRASGLFPVIDLLTKK